MQQTQLLEQQGQISIDKETDKILTTAATSAKVFTDDTTTAYPSNTYEGPMPFCSRR